MTDAWKSQIPLLLSQCHSGYLATIGIHGPETSMTPFANQQGNILLHLSTLARHTKNISHQSDVGFMICTPETPATSPLSLPRLSLQGTIQPVPESQYKAAQAAYLNHIPDAQSLFCFGDFKLFYISPSHIQWIGGFGSARKITLESWHRLYADEMN